MSNDFNEKTADVNSSIKCKDCGANLKFAPGTKHLSCDYCGAKNEIETEAVAIEETDFEAFLAEKEHQEDKQQISTVQCDNCGAATTLQPHITASSCPYCDTPLVIKNATTSSILKPGYVLPFRIDRKGATTQFLKWVNGLWFAPDDLKKYAKDTASKLNGIYMPYWTFDSETTSQYTGQRGDYYWETETYTTTENGESVTRTRQVRRTAWSYASGTVYNSFDDLLVCASSSLPTQVSLHLEPWDLDALEKYDDRFLSGFITESYQVDLKQGFATAKELMRPAIHRSIEHDIGGDCQRIDDVSSNYQDTTFKHILLPLWISAYRYDKKVYRFIINARTGEVHGERPYSAVKILLLVLAIVAVAVAIFILSQQNASY